MHFWNEKSSVSESTERPNIDQNLYQKLFDVAGDSIIVCSEQGLAIECNQAALDLFVCTRAQLIGSSPADWSPEFQPYGRASTEMAGEIFARAATGEVVRFYWQNTRADGTPLPVDVTVRVARIGDHILFVIISRDVTERKQAEVVLKASEEKYRTLIETTATGYLIVDGEGRVLDANPEYVRLTGHDELRDILGRSVIEWTASHERERNARAVAQCAKEGYVRNLVIDYVDRKGRVTPVEINATVITDGGALRILSLCRDVTERKRSELELLASRQAAENASLTKSRFLAAASHDLRQPIQAISLFKDALIRTGLSGEQRQISDYLSESIQSLSDLLNILLDISRLDAGAVKSCPEPVQVEALFSQINARFSAIAAEKSLRFKLRLPFHETTVITDRNLLLDLLSNVIGNAIKYTEQGSILVGIRRRGDQALIQVWDTGIGIAPEHLDTIFEEYVQIGNPERDRTKGLGLGLAIAKRLATVLETDVVCRSRPGKGSVFEFRLPCAKHVLKQEQSRIKAAPRDTGATPGHARRNIVVVEDDVMVAKAIQLSLELQGMSVTRYANAEDALASPEIMTADFYISDFGLPGLNGIEFLDAVRHRLAKPVKAVLLTGDTSSAQITTTESLPWTVLFKPISLPRLLAAIESQDSAL
jgi:PAS domain S-box-containing protein